MAITPEDIDKLSELSRLALTDEEKQSLHTDLVEILGYVDQIKEVSDATPEIVPPVQNVLREDTDAHESGVHTKTVLGEAPEQDGTYLKVKKILGGSDAA